MKKPTRDATDKQLAAERVKTNEFIEKVHADEIRNTNKKIKENRKVSLNKRQNKVATVANMSKERDEEDKIREVENNKKTSLIDSALSQERTDTDLKITDERTQNDSDAAEDQILHDAAITIRDQFLSIVSHDLKNPLNAILMSVDLIKKKIQMGQPLDQTKMLDIIYRNALNINRMITDLLDMERIAQKKLVLKLDKVDLGDLIRECQLLFEPIILEKKFTLKVNLDQESTIVKADKDRITQVISNLIGNSLKFAPVGGEITITLKDYQDKATIAVSDNGPGIPKDKRDQIFEKFSQLSAGPMMGSGLGLGLFISKWIVESHQGKIEVLDGPGANFRITLPK